MCTKDVVQGESLLVIPLRLGIIDHAPDVDSYDDLLEVSRLAIELLREHSLAERSQRYPWLQVLPVEIPSLYGCFPETLYTALQGSVAEVDLNKAQSRAAAEYAKIHVRDLIGNATEADFQWAISVVHSRAFSVPGKQNGVDVSINMMMPLVDMLNHRGKECSFLLSDESQEESNVRWDVVRPESSQSGDWEMVVSATRAIEAGEDAWLCYSAEPGSQFLLHYGFVPNRNQFEQVILFQSISEAVDWAVTSCPPEGLPRDPDVVSGCRERALQAAREAADKDSAGPLHLDVQDKADLIKFSAGNRLDDRLFAALTSLAGGGAQGQWYATEALAKRCEQLLSLSGRSHLLADLHILASSLPDEDGDYFPALKEHYTVATSLLEQSGRIEASSIEGFVEHEQQTLSYLELQAVKLRAYQKMLLWDAIIQFHGSRYLPIVQ